MNRVSSIGNAAIILTLFGILGKATGFFREILFANYFGTSREYEWYLVASVLPITLNSVALYFFQNFFVPTFSKFKESSESTKNLLIKKTFYGSLLTGFSILLIILLFRSQLLGLYIGTGLISEKTEILFIIFSLTIPPSFLIGFLTAYSQVNFNFRSPAFATLFINVFTITAIFIFKGEGIIEISFAYLLGILTQALYLIKITGVLKVLKVKISENDERVVIAFGSIFWILMIELIGQIYILSDRYFLSAVDEGGIAALNYATTIFLLPITILLLPITTAMLPKVSELWSQKLYSEFKSKINSTLLFIPLLFIPITIAFVFWSRELVFIFFQRGNFDYQSTELTKNVLIYLSLSICVYSLYGIINKLFYVFEMVRTLFIITIIGILGKVIFNFSLVNLLKQDGLALSTSLSYLLFFILAATIIQIKKNIIDVKALLSAIVIYLFNSLLSVYITDRVTSLFNIGTYGNTISIFLIFATVYFLTNKFTGDLMQQRFMDELLKYRFSKS